MRRVCHVADVREKARRRLPRALFDYIDGAAEDEADDARQRARLPESVSTREWASRSTSRTSRPRFSPDPPINARAARPMRSGLLDDPCGARGALRAAHQAGTVSVLSRPAGVTPEEFGN